MISGVIGQLCSARHFRVQSRQVCLYACIMDAQELYRASRQVNIEMLSMERKLSKRKVDSIDKGREMKKSKSGLSELDRLFQRLYEDRASGAISERNHGLLADKYEAERWSSTRADAS
jgi:hypothetical protein